MRTASAARTDVCAFAVMAKAPRSGAVKTRLVPPLSGDETLPAWYDVDDETSLGWLCHGLLAGRRLPDFSPMGYNAPHTTAYLHELVAAGRIPRLVIDEALEDQVSP